MFILVVCLPYSAVMCSLVVNISLSVDDLMGEKFNKHRVHDICLHRRTGNKRLKSLYGPISA